MGKDLPSIGQERDTSVVVAGLAVTFPLVGVDQGGIFQLLWGLSFTPHGLEEPPVCSKIQSRQKSAMHQMPST